MKRVWLPGEAQPHMMAILAVVAERWGVSVTLLTGASHELRISDARHVAMYLAREMTDLSNVAIGKQIGGRHYSTVMHGIRKVTNSVRHFGEVRDLVTELEATVRRTREKRFQNFVTRTPGRIIPLRVGPELAKRDGIPLEKGAQGRSGQPGEVGSGRSELEGRRNG